MKLTSNKRSTLTKERLTNLRKKNLTYAQMATRLQITPDQTAYYMWKTGLTKPRGKVRTFIRRKD